MPVHLVHGTADDMAPVHHSRDFVPVLDRWGWPVALNETGTDHAGAVMTEYDPARQRCVPARSAGTLEAGRTTARVLARAAGLPVPGDSPRARWPSTPAPGNQYPTVTGVAGPARRVPRHPDGR